MQAFKKKYVSPVATIGIFIGLLPFFLLRWLLSTTHQLSAPFCDNCWSKFSPTGKIKLYCQLGFVLSILLGIISAVYFQSPTLFVVIFSIGVIALIYGQLNEYRHSPKFKKIDAKQVIIKTPSGEEMAFTK